MMIDPNNLTQDPGAPSLSSVVSGGSTNPGSGSGVGAAIGGLLGTTPAGVNINNPNGSAYGQVYNNALQQGQNYGYNGGNAQLETGPTIANPYQAASQANLGLDRNNLSSAYGQASQLATNGSQLAQNQFQQNLDQGIAAQSALANSSRGGAVGRAGALRQAQENAGQMNAGAAAQAGQIQAQSQLQGLNAEGSLASAMGGLDQGQYGLEQNNAQQQAQLQLGAQGQGQNFAAQLYGLQQGANQSALAAQNGYNNAAAQSEGLQIQQNQGQAAANGQAISGVASAAGSLLALSDARAKTDVYDGGSMADDFLRHVDPRAYKYKDPSLPGAESGQHLGVMAQDLERTKGIGSTLVQDSPDGYKRVAIAPTLSAALGGLGRLNERLEMLEKGRR